MDSLLNSSKSNKYLKEEFVSNLTGSSLIEIAAHSAIVPALILLRHLVDFENIQGPVYASTASMKKDDAATSSSCKRWRAYVIMMVLDILFIVLPILLFLTVLSEWAEVCGISLMILLLLFIVVKSSGSFDSGQESIHYIRKVISSYRVSMMIVTCLCILAVDFKIYPRRYAKTETYGTGLMDLGVGSFVLANALVSRQARNSGTTNWKAAIQSTSPLIILGFGRLIFTTGVNYQAAAMEQPLAILCYVHVGEYGVHWNFFFTLAAVSILTTTINIRPQYCGFVGLSIIIGYQICLICGLNEYLLANERTAGIVSQNKEGILSILGYWGLYLIGVFLANNLFFGKSSGQKMGSNHSTSTRIWTLSILFWLLTVIFDKCVERVSRRMCNLSYVTFILAQSFQVLAILTLSDFIPGKKTSVLEEAFNQNLLGIFLLANILTGLVNMQFDTIAASSTTALAILFSYSFILCIAAGFAAYFGIKMKFW